MFADADFLNISIQVAKLKHNCVDWIKPTHHKKGSELSIKHIQVTVIEMSNLYYFKNFYMGCENCFHVSSSHAHILFY